MQESTIMVVGSSFVINCFVLSAFWSREVDPTDRCGSSF